MDASLTRLESARDDLARRWLVRVIERSSLDEVAELPVDRIARELPGLVSELVRAAAEGPQEGAETASEERLVELLTDLRGRDRRDPVELTRDVAALQSVIAEALASSLSDHSARSVLGAVDRLSGTMLAVLGVAVSELGERRARQLEGLSGMDAVTGLPNARQLRRQLAQFVAIQQRYGHPFALLALDIEGLRRINDAHGREAGDRALADVAAVVRGAVRAADSVARLDDDELCVLAPHQTALGGRAIGERLADAVGRLERPEGVPVGIAIGVAGCPEHAVEEDRLLELADEAMYRAKASGEPVAVAAPPLARAAGEDER
ncbi:MAG: diguanylate cyclase domain-containing protein [Thermoleophilaceae bacterium]